MDSRKTANVGVVTECHVSGTSGAMTHGDVITYLTVVCDVSLREKSTIVTDGRGASFRSSTVNTDKLANRIPIPDFCISYCILDIFLVLGLDAQRDEREDITIFADFRMRSDDNVGSKYGVRANPGIFANGAEWTDDAVFADFGVLVNNRVFIHSNHFFSHRQLIGMACFCFSI